MFNASLAVLDFSVRLTDVAIIFATILGPILAVWASDYRRAKEERRARKAAIFRTLMATRSSPAATSHVEAINLIELEFSSSDNRDSAVIDAWRLYRLHLDTNAAEAGWESRRRELHCALLITISKALGYAFTMSDVTKGGYYPIAHGEIDSETNKSRKLWIEFLEGKRAVMVKPSLPPDPPHRG